ncbi:MAG TPA: hypothetical protein DCX01_05215 [Bacteroidetes bacterium]|nr:hypothetical protein [Bacteroidota bacterium]
MQESQCLFQYNQLEDALQDLLP